MSSHSLCPSVSCTRPTDQIDGAFVTDCYALASIVWTTALPRNSNPPRPPPHAGRALEAIWRPHNRSLRPSDLRGGSSLRAAASGRGTPAQGRGGPPGTRVVPPLCSAAGGAYPFTGSSHGRPRRSPSATRRATLTHPATAAPGAQRRASGPESSGKRTYSAQGTQLCYPQALSGAPEGG